LKIGLTSLLIFVIQQKKFSEKRTLSFEDI